MLIRSYFQYLRISDQTQVADAHNPRMQTRSWSDWIIFYLSLVLTECSCTVITVVITFCSALGAWLLATQLIAEKLRCAICLGVHRIQMRLRIICRRNLRLWINLRTRIIRGCKFVISVHLCLYCTDRSAISLVFTARNSYAIAVLEIVILSVRLFVRHARALWPVSYTHLSCRRRG